ncbi:hypothetical protein KSD_93020 [Ktedonobacter sp. SOSP1-85]|uniref:hypothetical protein n=1 Tax=Ktedonobacter sp. SOSP1-85 TaxID=2778367 RepID=UPI00191568FE|nr:hypothetical protein [Ktedonobacter sp. SOSP1-85]GHO81531.1 hypothetical protein KSD_93020 [Ktedonobacter sp. SOSP1-85]
MHDLLARAIAAHGGLDRWNTFKGVTATIVTGGGLWPMKGLEQDPNPREETVTLHEETASVSPFGQPDWHTAFTPDRIAIETTTGAVVSERLDPRASFVDHVMNTPWDPLQRAYFNGYAMWTYLTTPFLLAMPGFEVAEISPWQEGGELWRGLRARFPDAIASHSKEQDFYFGDDFLLRRHDYHVDVAGGFPAAQYVYDIVEAEGLRFPTKRRAYVRGPGLKPIRDLLMVSIDLSNFRLTT